MMMPRNLLWVDGLAGAIAGVVVLLNQTTGHWHIRGSMRCAHDSAIREDLRAHGARYRFSLHDEKCPNLLWFDLARGWLSEWYRLPPNLLFFIGVANVAYASWPN